MTEKEIKSEVKKLAKKLQKKGDAIVLLYEGQELGRCDFIEWSPDCKTPGEWINQCLCFDVKLRGRDINKCEIKFVSE